MLRTARESPFKGDSDYRNNMNSHFNVNSLC